MIGVHDFPAGTYHADDVADRPTLSSSIAKVLIGQSPAHARARHPKLNPSLVRSEKAKYDVGTAAHAALLQGLDIVAVLDYENWRTKASQEARDVARAAGKTPLLAGQYLEMLDMVDAVKEQLAKFEAMPPLFTDGAPEQTMVWEDSGVLCRARVDWLRDDHRTVDDLKTTSSDAHPDGWTRKTMFSIGADVQAAFYIRGVRALFGVEPEFRFVAVETELPFAVSVISPGPAVRALADAKVDYALDLWKRCLANDSWTGYPTRVCYAELPAWEESRWLEREARDAA